MRVCSIFCVTDGESCALQIRWSVNYRLGEVYDRLEEIWIRSIVYYRFRRRGTRRDTEGTGAA